MIESDIFAQKLENIKIALRKEITKSEQGLCDKSIHQLKIINSEIFQMEHKRNYEPSFPKIIIDAWNYDDSLGQELMEFFMLYKKLR